MWAFGFVSPKGERLIYRGYALEICKHPIGWRLGISPIQPELPILANRNFTVPYPRKDDALTAARKRIDILLAVWFEGRRLASAVEACPHRCDQSLQLLIEG